MKDEKNFDSWSELISSGADHSIPELSPNVYSILVRKLYPNSMPLWFQILTGFLLFLSPPLFGALTLQSEDAILPVILYAIYGVMTVLWIVPLATRIYRKGGAELILASRVIDARLHLRKRGSHI